MKIKDSLKRESNKYLVVPKMLKFCRKNKLEGNFRYQYIESIEKFAEESEENLEEVNKWLDEAVMEGIKYIYIGKIEFVKDDFWYKSELFWKDFMNKFNIKSNVHINDCESYDELTYGGINITIENKNVQKVNLIISLMTADATKSYEHPYIEGYPIFVEIDIDKKNIVARLKSKSKLFRVKDDNKIKVIDIDRKIGFDKLAYQVVKKISSDVGFNIMDNREFHEIIKSSYYKILDEITKTPDEIVHIINKCEQLNSNYIDDIIKETTIDEEVYRGKMKEDLNMLLEKFISISYPNKDIFKGAYAFPIKLIATDSEDTKVEETSSNLQPLQTKAAFYDHKRIIQTEKKCDGMKLVVNRNDTKYYGRYPFIVKCDFVSIKGLGRIRFDEYVEEVDIQNVLSRVISTL